MVKKKSSTKEFRKIAQVTYGGAMVGQMMPLLQNPHVGGGNLYNAGVGMGGIAVNAMMSDVAFGAIDNIYKSGKKKK